MFSPVINTPRNYVLSDMNPAQQDEAQVKKNKVSICVTEPRLSLVDAGKFTGSAKTAHFNDSRLAGAPSSSSHAAELVKETLLASSSSSFGVQHHPFLDLEEINRTGNGIAMSEGGKTAGVLFVTDKKTARTMAALKLVNEKEIFANNFFSIFNMPTPKFKIVDKKEFSTDIQKKFNCINKSFV